jgi:hypothetical protein
MVAGCLIDKIRFLPVLKADLDIFKELWLITLYRKVIMSQTHDEILCELGITNCGTLIFIRIAAEVSLKPMSRPSFTIK